MTLSGRAAAKLPRRRRAFGTRFFASSGREKHRPNEAKRAQTMPQSLALRCGSHLFMPSLRTITLQPVKNGVLVFLVIAFPAVHFIIHLIFKNNKRRTVNPKL
jgi:hypothetical protein